MLAMEWAPRGDLQLLRCALERPLAEDQLAELVVGPLCEALAHLHAKVRVQACARVEVLSRHSGYQYITRIQSKLHVTEQVGNHSPGYWRLCVCGDLHVFAP